MLEILQIKVFCCQEFSQKLILKIMPCYQRNKF